MDVLGLRGRGHFSGSDGPDRFVRDHNRVDFFNTFQAVINLPADHIPCNALFSFFIGLSHAHDRDEPVGQGLVHF
ncbi:MAG: hypothetical protein BWX55_00238 [Deltaproteobacteria bacterium ADurb.Bin022]|nr:MAG: hypothetical protein BWX55_00238 [Deltaproteobacteria bacterium ADurb.Bin022]